MDKGEAREIEKNAALEEAAYRLLPRARVRREQANRDPIVDYLDIPVFQGYVNQVIAKGAVLRHRSRWFNAVSVTLDADLIKEIEDLPFVRTVEPVRKLAPSGPRLFPADTDYHPAGIHIPPGPDPALADTALYGPSFEQLDEIGVIAVHDSGYTGAGVLVGMFDTGFYKVHQSLKDQPVIAEWDFVFEDGETQNEAGDVEGQHNHGTATWSALGGYSPYNLIGPAYGASFFLAKTEDIGSETPLEEDNYVAALEWADSLGVGVVSSSLAYRLFDDSQYDYSYEDLNGDVATITVAVDIAASRGILVSSAMANEGPSPGSLWTPADADSMLAVGAVDSDNQIMDFSSRGPTSDGRTKPEVVARGYGTYSASAQSAFSYQYASGTSLSTPLVGGSAALVWEAHPEWGAMDVRDALMQTADRAGFPDNDYGWGRINVHAAIYDISPPIYPLPFDLTLPEDGDSTSSPDILFSWEPSRDPDSGDPITYTLWIASDADMVDIVHETSTTDTSIGVEGVLAEDSFYYWTVLAADLDVNQRRARRVYEVFTGSATGVEEEKGVPKSWSGLLQNYPNPFNPQTTITFSVAEGDGAVDVRLAVFDMRGRLIRTLLETSKTSGIHQVSWDGTDDSGTRVGSGLYFYRLTVDGNTVTRKMNLLK